MASSLIAAGPFVVVDQVKSRGQSDPRAIHDLTVSRCESQARRRLQHRLSVAVRRRPLQHSELPAVWSAAMCRQ